MSYTNFVQEKSHFTISVLPIFFKPSQSKADFFVQSTVTADSKSPLTYFRKKTREFFEKFVFRNSWAKQLELLLSMYNYRLVTLLYIQRMGCCSSTGPLACLYLFSIIFLIRPSTSCSTGRPGDLMNTQQIIKRGV